MVLQPDFFLSNVKLLYIINEFLFKAVLVVVHLFDLGKSVEDAALDFLYAGLLISRHLIEQRLDGSNLFLKESLQAGTLLPAELNQLLSRLSDNIFDNLQLFFVGLVRFGFGLEGIRHSQQRCIPVLGQGQAELRRHLLDLNLVLRQHRNVDGACGCALDGLAIDKQINLAALERL